MIRKKNIGRAIKKYGCMYASHPHTENYNNLINTDLRGSPYSRHTCQGMVNNITLKNQMHAFFLEAMENKDSIITTQALLPQDSPRKQFHKSCSSTPQ
jgi:hypothetical protein